MIDACLRAGVLCLALLCAGAPVWARSGAREGAGYLKWLEQRSMLWQAAQAALPVSGEGVQWRHAYAQPQPRRAVQRASVWLLDYAGSVVTRPGQSVIAAWGEPELWRTFAAVGIDLLHTGPLSLSGGVDDRKQTPTTDGWFDRISLELDPALGTEAEYMRMVATAQQHRGLIAGDLVPLHTGTGPDFRLAQRNYRDYPGMFSMVEIRREDWGLLPPVKGPWKAAHILKPASVVLTGKGYIPGWINSCDADPQARTWSGWSATGEIRGADGVVRRWVFLHYFKQSQPALNWGDPSFAAQRAIAGDVVRTVHQRRTPIVRLDAVPFLGLEGTGRKGETWHYMHPLSVTGTEYVAFLVRKMGGWSFHELNVPFPTLKEFTKSGPDLSYDFFTRTQVLHALLSGDARPLSLVYRWFLEAGVQPIGLVHDMQNHDEITYQLVELAHRGEATVDLGGEKISGKQLRERMQDQMRRTAAGPAAPYNKLYRPEKDGLATTYAGFVAPAVGVLDPHHATPEEVERIRRGHLLLAAANALQPGVFSLSSWDLVGALPLPEASVADRTVGGDWRWVNRGGVDLLGANRAAKRSAFGLPRAASLYGSLPEQLASPTSFASQLTRMLAARKRVRLHEGELMAAPVTRNPAFCVLVFTLPDRRRAVTVLNFGKQDGEESVEIPVTGWTDMVTGAKVASDRGRTVFRVPALTGTTFVEATN